MEKYNLKDKKIEAHNILFATTSERDYSMERLLLLEDMPDTEYNEFILAEGSHCSCYGFDETEWDCIKITRDELYKIIEQNDWGLRKRLKEFLKSY